MVSAAPDSCDWWFADEAVLIDTAGRYATTGLDAVVDRAGWEGFLDLLRRTRKRQPLNGAIVVVLAYRHCAPPIRRRGPPCPHRAPARHRAFRPAPPARTGLICVQQGGPVGRLQ